MLFGDILIALAAAFILTVVFSYSFGRTSAWPGVILFFIFVFLAAWTGGLWVTTGPAYRGLSWVPYVVAGLIIAVILAWVTAQKGLQMKQPRAGTPAEIQPAESPLADIFAWTIIGLFVVLIILGYLSR
jgi:hypothetical protein